MEPIIDKSCQAHIAAGIAAELYASNLYLHVANRMQRMGYTGAMKFFHGEAEDERKHYQIHVDFLDDVGLVASVPAVPAITEEPKSLRDAVEIALDTERELLDQYRKAYTESSDDPAVLQHLLQFIEIQRKAVGEYGDLLARLDRAGTDAAAILLIDQELGA